MQVDIKELQSVFQNAFGEPVSINLDTKKDDLDQWDSINHLNLIVELEDQFKISFTKEEIEKIDSIQLLLNVLNTK